MSGLVKICKGGGRVSELPEGGEGASEGRERATHDVGVLADVVTVVLGRVAVERRDLDGLEAVDAADELAERALLVLRERLGREHVERRRVRVGLERLHDGQLVDERLARRGRRRDDDVLPSGVLGRRVQRVDGGGLVRVQVVGPDVLGAEEGVGESLRDLVVELACVREGSR